MTYIKVTAFGSEEVKSLPLLVRLFGKPLWNGDYTYRDDVYLINKVTGRPRFGEKVKDNA